MGIGGSLFLIAAGAIVTFAVKVHTKTIDLDVLGWILMGIGALGLILSIFFYGSWGGFSSTRDSYSSEPR